MPNETIRAWCPTCQAETDQNHITVKGANGAVQVDYTNCQECGEPVP